MRITAWGWVATAVISLRNSGRHAIGCIPIRYNPLSPHPNLTGVIAARCISPDRSLPTEDNQRRHDAYASLRAPNFRLLIATNALTSFAHAILSVLIGWEIYERTHSPFQLGLVGLVQIVPNLILAIPAGHVVDRHDPKRIAVASIAIEVVAASIIATATAAHWPLVVIFLALALIGIGRAIRSPTNGPIMSGVMTHELFENASAWNGGVDHLAAIIGPAVGGLAVAAIDDTAPIFAASAVLLALGAISLARVRLRGRVRETDDLSRATVLAGARFIRQTPIMLAAISLDMFAVLLGGATALLPIFADDILHVGAGGLGIMRAAPAAGALLTSLAVAHKGAFQRAGRSLLCTVAGFGIATLVFGLSRWFPLSVAALGLIGGFDAISMIVRDTLELRFTPDAMRGRVAAIHFLFIGMSNEFGEFESGLAASLIGASAAVAVGGIGTIAVVIGVSLLAPELRRLGRIEPDTDAVSLVASDMAESPVV
jgi:MFS family permease